MSKINVAIIGAGNCAKSLVEGVQYYTENPNNVTGMMKSDIGGYKAENINFVAGFEIDERKVDQTLGTALKQRPNCAWDIVDEIKSTAPVYQAPVIDGYAALMDNYPEANRFLVDEHLRNTTDGNRTSLSPRKIREWKDSIIEKLKEHEVEVLVNYLPVGSQKTTEFWAEICLETGISFVNCIPVFIASDPTWEKRFIYAGIPLN